MRPATLPRPSSSPRRCAMHSHIWFLSYSYPLLPYTPFSKDVNVVASWSVTLMTDGRAHDFVGCAARIELTHAGTNTSLSFAHLIASSCEASASFPHSV